LRCRHNKSSTSWQVQVLQVVLQVSLLDAGLITVETGEFVKQIVYLCINLY